MRFPNDEAIAQFRRAIEEGEVPGCMVCYTPLFEGMREALSDVTTRHPDDEAYDAGREIVRALLGID